MIISARYYASSLCVSALKVLYQPQEQCEEKLLLPETRRRTPWLAGKKKKNNGFEPQADLRKERGASSCFPRSKYRNETTSVGRPTGRRDNKKAMKEGLHNRSFPSSSFKLQRGKNGRQRWKENFHPGEARGGGSTYSGTLAVKMPSNGWQLCISSCKVRRIPPGTPDWASIFYGFAQLAIR